MAARKTPCSRAASAAAHNAFGIGRRDLCPLRQRSKRRQTLRMPIGISTASLAAITGPPRLWRALRPTLSTTGWQNHAACRNLTSFLFGHPPGRGVECKLGAPTRRSRCQLLDPRDGILSESSADPGPMHQFAPATPASCDAATRHLPRHLPSVWRLAGGVKRFSL